MKTRILRSIFSFALLFTAAATQNVYGQIQLISPNGGETWVNGANEFVTYTYSGNPTYLTVEYSSDNGVSYEIIDYVYTIQGTTQVPVFVNFSITSLAKIRVAEYNSNPLLFDESDNTFSVENPAYFFNSPFYGDHYYQGATILANWYASHNEPTDLSFSSDNGETWTLIATGITGSSYVFDAPEVESAQCKLRASITGNPAAFADSYIFTISPLPVFTLVSPNGGEFWTYNELETVSWTGENLPDYVALDYSLDGGISWTTIWYSYSSPTGGSDQIVVPQAASSIAKFRVRDPNIPSAGDESDDVFTIYTPPYIFYSPQAENRYYANQPIEVSWYSFEIENVDVAVSTDGGITYETVATNVNSQYYGSAVFNAPSIPSDNCVVKLSNSSDPSIFTISPVFEIVETPVLTLISPNGGEILDQNTEFEIKFEYSGEILYFTYLQIDFSSDNGQNWQALEYIYLPGGAQSFIWQTPEISSGECLIRLTDYYYPFITATSASTFTIEDFPDLQICMVGVDTTSGKNMIAWNKPISNLISEYVVLKEGNISNQYTEIASVPVDAPAVFVDESSNPRVKATRYKVTFRDAAGNIYPSESYHQTIHLTISKGVGDVWNLIWSPYVGFEVESYNIYRGTTPADMQLIGTVSGNFNSYSDFDAAPGFVYYMVEVVNPNNCDPGGERSLRLSSSMSNIATNYSVGFEENNLSASLSAYPNPVSENLKIRLPGLNSSSVQLQIFDSKGALVLEKSIGASDLTSGYLMDVSDLQPGIHALVVRSSEGNAAMRFIRK